jgi:very-short-patch-repair endonuclease
MTDIDVASELNRFRERLLDLTARNSLLNYRKSRTRTLQIVDEYPDKVYERLVTQANSFRFLPKREESEEQSLSEDDLLLERALELPEAAEKDELESRYTDSRLQTDLDPERLEYVLKMIRRMARSSIAETGVNFLYLALGLLEWTEHQDSDKTYLAPLILVPIEVERSFDGRSGRYEYSVASTGEEVQSNLCLVKKVEFDFNRALPEMDEDSTPEAYFESIEEAVADLGGWRVRREALIGFFSFRKLLMYLDLDPDRWRDGPLEHSGLLTQLFEGKQQDDVTSFFQPDYSIDGNETAESIALVDNADSSQHSALVDIAEGRTLVIEGPPGTGKSQTITNAIAAALNEDKTVLFVAEKLAALEVVQRKLQDLGLADFALQLHSETATAANVVDQLRKRLEDNFSKPEEIERIRRKRNDKRKELLDYLEACSDRCGPKDELLHEVFWRSIELRSQGLNPLGDVDVDTDVNEGQFDRRRMACQELGRHVQEIGSPAENPWRWLFCPNLRSVDADCVVDSVSRMADLSERMNSAARELASEIGGDVADWIATAVVLRPEDMGFLDLNPSDLDGAICRQCAPPESRRLAWEFWSNLCEYRRLSGDVLEHLTDPLEQVAANGPRASELRSDRVVRELLDVPVRWLRQAQSQLDSLRRTVQPVVDTTKYFEDAGFGQVTSLRDLHEVLSQYEVLSHSAAPKADELTDRLFLKRTEQVFSEARARSEDLEKSADKLRTRFVLDQVPSVEGLRDMRVAMDVYTRSVFGPLNLPYWRIRRKLKRFRSRFFPMRLHKWLPWIDQLISYLDKWNYFENEDKFSHYLGERFQGTHTEWDRLEELVRWAKTAKKHGLIFEEAKRYLDWLDSDPSCPEASHIKQKLEDLKAELRTDAGQLLFGGAADAQDRLRPTDLLSEIKRAGDAVRELIDLTHGWSLEDEQTVSRLLDRLNDAHAMLKVARQNERIAQRLGPPLGDVDDAAEPLETALRWLDAVDSSGFPDGILEWLIQEDDIIGRAQFLHAKMIALTGMISEWRASRQQLDRFGTVDTQFMSIRPSGISSDPTLFEFLSQLLEQIDMLVPWANFCRAVSEAEELGLGGFTESILQGVLDAASAADTYELMLYEKIGNEAVRGSQVLRGFSRQRFENVRQSFQELDRELLELTRKQVAANADNVFLPPGNSTGRVGTFTEMGMLRHEITKQQRFPRIRSMLKRAPCSIQGLKPCFMMSPLSVAQYLPPGEIEFDLVLMDEASQIKPEDALGTVARAKQLVVVGDPKQLPPTSFFEKMADSDITEDQALIPDNTESILEVAMKAFPHVRRLKWHYRSLHEKLIAFSNEYFYDGDLVAFPSPVHDTGRLGIRYHQVEDAYYKNGKNPVEAQTIAQAIVDHATRNPDESLGVGTFNREHQSMIEDELDRICTSDPEARHAVARLSEGTDGLFVKNLENLQGDERDVIFIAYTYGPDPASGRVFNRFGPITASNGWRRLNVLVTRARRRVEVFSSMKPSDIHGGPEKSRGINAMKDYLEYAKTGDLKGHVHWSNRSPESPFEIAVARAVRNMGLEVVPQVGVAGYFIDLGVLKPERDDEFLLGIECDGKTYHSARSARERDRLREEIIRSRGWEIHRIWSTDWFQNQQAEEQRLCQQIQRLM